MPVQLNVFDDIGINHLPMNSGVGSLNSLWLPLHIYVCMYACMHACMHVCMHACMYVCMHACMHAYMHACMYACMNVCMYDSWHRSETARRLVAADRRPLQVV